jgi:CRISP-associated protein Cas1
MHVYNYYGYYSGSYVPRDKKVSGFVLVKQAENYLNDSKRDSATYHIIRNLKSHKEKTSDMIHLLVEERKKLLHVNYVQEIIWELKVEFVIFFYQSFSRFLRPEFSI